MYKLTTNVQSSNPPSLRCTCTCVGGSRNVRKREEEEEERNSWSSCCRERQTVGSSRGRAQCKYQCITTLWRCMCLWMPVFSFLVQLFADKCFVWIVSILGEVILLYNIARCIVNIKNQFTKQQSIKIHGTICRDPYPHFKTIYYPLLPSSPIKTSMGLDYQELTRCADSIGVWDSLVSRMCRYGTHTLPLGY